MDRSSLNALTLEKAAELLATRREASRLVGGFVKRAVDWEQLKGYLGQAGDYAKGIWNAKPDPAQLAQAGGGDYWKSVSQEALRNALLGGAGGAGLGALKSLINGDDDMLGSAITGGLAGGALGGAGTAAYRGLNASLAPKQTDAMQAAEQAQIDKRKNDPNLVEKVKGQLQQHFGVDVDKSPTTKAVADIINEFVPQDLLSADMPNPVTTVAPNENSAERPWGYKTHVLGGGVVGNATGRLINRLLLPHTIRNNFSAEPAGGGIPPSTTAAATATGQPTLLASIPGMGLANQRSLHPRRLTQTFNPHKLLYETYRPASVPPSQFATQVRMAQGWRNRLPMGLGLVGAGLGAMEARKPPGTSAVDAIPFTPTPTPKAKEITESLSNMSGGVRDNWSHYAGENLRELRDAAAELPSKLPTPSDQAPMF